MSRIKHDLHLIKKGTLSVKEYKAKIRNTYALIEASRHKILESEVVEIVLSDLSPKFNVVITLTSFSSEPLPLRKLVDILFEYENRQ